MAWPRGKPRKPKPEQTKPEVESAPAASEPKPSDNGASNSPPPPKDAKPRAQWRLPREGSLADRAKAAARDLEWRDRSGDDLLAPPEEAHQWLRENNLVAQWIAVKCLGQELTRHVAQLQANGWTPCQEGEVPGVPEVLIDGTTLLHVRSRSIHERALKAQKDAALGPVRNRQQMLIEGVPGVTGSDHVSAKNYNRIKRTMERLEIPTD
jgi:hypothetical protein